MKSLFLKPLIWGTLSVIFLLGCSKAHNGVAQTRKSPQRIQKEVQKGKAYLVDVRTPEEYKEGSLQNSKNIDYKAPNFKTNINTLDKDKIVYLYCRSGNRSGKALDTLKALGFREIYNIGGYEDLKKQGLP